TATGLLARSSTNLAGINNEVRIQGTVENHGGVVSVSSPLNITGFDSNCDSYYQSSYFTQMDALGILKVNAGGHINAAGVYDIQAGTVQQTAGASPADQLDGEALTFS